jgi:hypothetical protein
MRSHQSLVKDDSYGRERPEFYLFSRWEILSLCQKEKAAYSLTDYCDDIDPLVSLQVGEMPALSPPAGADKHDVGDGVHAAIVAVGCPPRGH